MATHSAHILTHDGDLTLTWDTTSIQDRQNVQEVFEAFLEMGYEAYQVTDKPAALDRAIGVKYRKSKVKSLNERAGQLIFCKKVVIAPTKVEGGYPELGMNKGRI